MGCSYCNGKESKEFEGFPELKMSISYNEVSTYYLLDNGTYNVLSSTTMLKCPFCGAELLNPPVITLGERRSLWTNRTDKVDSNQIKLYNDYEKRWTL